MGTGGSNHEVIWGSLGVIASWICWSELLSIFLRVFSVNCEAHSFKTCFFMCIRFPHSRPWLLPIRTHLQQAHEHRYSHGDNFDHGHEHEGVR